MRLPRFARNDIREVARNDVRGMARNDIREVARSDVRGMARNDIREVARNDTSFRRGEAYSIPFVIAEG